MPRRSSDWYDKDGNLNLSLFIKNNPHDSRIMGIFSKIDAMRRADKLLTKSTVLLDALHVWAGVEAPPSDNELLSTLIDMVGSIHHRLDDLQSDIDQLAAQGVQVQGIQQRTDQLRATTEAPQALAGMFARHQRENE